MKTSSNSCNLSLCVPRPSFAEAQLGNFLKATLVESDIPKTDQDNFVLIRVDRFGFSANNITYQALGEAAHFRYFDFHDVPETADTSRKSHGLIPVWGFGTVMWSSHKRIEAGERVYGYFAPTRYLLLPISPSDVNKYSFFVSRPHFPRDRRPYNQIIRCKTDPQYDPSPDIEDLTMIYRPLFWTSFWCEDWLATSTLFRGSSCFIISSASSKTAFCLAYLIRKRFHQGAALPSLNIVGLTSSKNVGFTRSLGLYDAIVDYGTLPTLFDSIIKDEKSCVYVDVAGNDALNAQIRSSFLSHSAKLSAEVILGLTNLSPASSAASSFSWTQNIPLLDASRIKDPLPQPPSFSNYNPTLPPSSTSVKTINALPVPVQFFMPEWLAIRRTQLSVAQITAMQADAWEALLHDGKTWISIERTFGGENVRRAFKEIEKSGVGPERGLVWSMWDADETIDTNGGTLAKL